MRPILTEISTLLGKVILWKTKKTLPFLGCHSDPPSKSNLSKTTSPFSLQEKKFESLMKFKAGK